jgi:hypothetical protein
MYANLRLSSARRFLFRRSICNNSLTFVICRLCVVQAFGKPIGLVARVNIGQIIFSVRSKESNLKHVIEALRRCKYKFPGRQNIVVSNKWSANMHTLTPLEARNHCERTPQNLSQAALKSAAEACAS